MVPATTTGTEMAGISLAAVTPLFALEKFRSVGRVSYPSALLLLTTNQRPSSPVSVGERGAPPVSEALRDVGGRDVAHVLALRDGGGPVLGRRHQAVLDAVPLGVQQLASALPVPPPAQSGGARCGWMGMVRAPLSPGDVISRLRCEA